MGIGEASPAEQRLRPHNRLRTLSVTVGDPVIVRHALVHLSQLAYQLPRRTVEHHQHGRRAEGPAAAVPDADGLVGHLRAGTAVQAAHGADVVVAQKAHDEVALAQQIASFLLRHLRMLPDGGKQNALQLHHFGDIPPVEHAAHEHQQRRRVPLQRGNRALRQRFQHSIGGNRGQQNARVLLHHPQQRIVVAAAPVERHGVEIPAAGFIPLSEPRVIYGLLLPVQRGKGALRAFLHHVVKPVCNAVLQTLDKGVLLCEGGQDLLCVRVTGDEARHLHGKLIGKAHDRQKLPPLFRKRVDHGRRKGGIDVGMTAWQHTMLGKCAQIQVNSGKPALAGIEDLVDLRVGQLRAAPVGVDGQLRVVEPQLLRAQRIDLRSQPHCLRVRQEAIPAGHDQVHIVGQAVGQHTQKGRRPLIQQQVKIIYEDVAGHLPRQPVAEIIRQQPAAGGIHRAWIVPQHIKAGAGKGVLNASPEYGQIVRIHVDPDDLHGLRSGALGQIPVHRRGLTVAHGRHHSGQRAAGNRPQTLPQPLRYINGIQIPFPLCHGSPPDRFAGEPHPQPPPAAQRMVR